MNPLDEYQRRLADRRARRDLAFARMQRVSASRLTVAILFVAAIWQAYTIHVVSGWFALLPAAAFVALAVYHESLRRAWKRAKRAVTFYERGLDRLEDRWQGTGNPGNEYLREEHLYATDLDILGPASLFELLCTATTRSGETTLARWLCAPTSRVEILQRQEAIRELRDQVDLREDLSMIGADVRSNVNPEFLSSWAADPSALNSTVTPIVAVILVGAMLVTAVYAIYPAGRSLPVVSVLALEGLLGYFYRRRVQDFLRMIDEAARELGVLGLALRRLEKEKYSSERLRQLQTNLSTGDTLPSRKIESLVRRVDTLNFRRNEFFMIFSFPLLWATRYSFAIEGWRKRYGSEVGAWMANFGEFEALCALAGYAYEHPEDPFPEIVENDQAGTAAKAAERRLMQLGPDAGTGSENQQPDRFAAIAQRQDKQSGPPVFARLRIAHHRACAVIDLGFFSRCRDDDSGRLRLLYSAQFASKALHALITAIEAILGDQILPDRHGIAASAQTQFDGFPKWFTSAGRWVRCGQLKRRFFRKRPYKVGGHPGLIGRFCRLKVGGHPYGRF